MSLIEARFSLKLNRLERALFGEHGWPGPEVGIALDSELIPGNMSGTAVNRFSEVSFGERCILPREPMH